jgi:putative ATP-binding cassette transporter
VEEHQGDQPVHLRFVGHQLGQQSPQPDLEIEDKTRVQDGEFTTLDLSGGQRKRLALLVAMLEDRPIIVLDEWAADQDPVFRKKFYEVILPELKRQGKTIIAITHDDRYFEGADRQLKLEDGQIAADIGEGSHA